MTMTRLLLLTLVLLGTTLIVGAEVGRTTRGSSNGRTSRGTTAHIPTEAATTATTTETTDASGASCGGVDVSSPYGGQCILPSAKVVEPILDEDDPTLITVKNFKPDVPPMTQRVYPHLIPLNTSDAYVNTSLLVLPGPLIPLTWEVETEIGELTLKRVFADPMVLTMEKFLTQEEAQELIDYGTKLGYKRSMTTAGVHASRTSESAYMPDGPLKHKVLSRCAKIMNVKEEEIEMGPLLRYKEGQLFDYHYDSSQGVTYGRRATFFVPLSSVEEGGHTGFPFLNYSYPPIPGSAVIWRNYEPAAEEEDYDYRMKHGGEPPKKGVKYAVNLWIYKQNYLRYAATRGNTGANGGYGSGGSPAVTRTSRPRHADGPIINRQIPLLTVAAPSLQTPWLHSIPNVGTVTVYPAFPDSTFLFLRIPDFITLEERQALIAAGDAAGWRESLTSTGISSGRTSASTWIYHTPVQQALRERVAALVGVPVENVEANSMTRYSPGQYYHPHFDSQRDNVPDRLMTVHIPLSSDPDEEVGHLYFPTFHRRFRQTPGTAFVWRNYLPGDPNHDPLSRHGYDAPQAGTIHTLTMWIFPYSLTKPKTLADVASTASMLAGDTTATLKLPTEQENQTTPSTTTTSTTATTAAVTDGSTTVTAEDIKAAQGTY